MTEQVLDRWFRNPTTFNPAPESRGDILCFCVLQQGFSHQIGKPCDIRNQSFAILADRQGAAGTEKERYPHAAWR
jgi:hypothetical protein